MEDRKTYTFEVETKVVHRISIQVVGASSEEEAQKRAILAAQNQAPPREKGDPLPHVYFGGRKIVHSTDEPVVVSVEAEPYKPCSCQHCNKEESL
ncbi:MAG: hypothetical protein GF334_10340 [Candidatus Altiarchaeales archaeon]|nr:hypothetical protein [Candidatus Altiarchaeales archaeon]